MASNSMFTAEKAQTGTKATWAATVAACVFIGWTGFTLYYSTGAFVGMFASLAVELPLPARLLFASYRWLYPIVFGSLAAGVITKEFYVREKWANLTVTVVTVLGVDLLARGIVMELYRPLLVLVDKLK